MKQCPICEQAYIPYMGDGSVLILGSSPTEDEMQYGRPFTGRNMQLWKSHLMQYAKLDFHDCRFGLLNTHTSKKDFAKECEQFNVQLAIKEMSQISKVIFVGADSTRLFTGYKISQVNGLDVSDLVVPDFGEIDNIRFFAMVTPATIFTSQGEYYFAMNKLGEWLNG